MPEDKTENVPRLGERINELEADVALLKELLEETLTQVIDLTELLAKERTGGG